MGNLPEWIKDTVSEWLANPVTRTRVFIGLGASIAACTIGIGVAAASMSTYSDKNGTAKAGEAPGNGRGTVATVSTYEPHTPANGAGVTGSFWGGYGAYGTGMAGDGSMADTLSRQEDAGDDVTGTDHPAKEDGTGGDAAGVPDNAEDDAGEEQGSIRNATGPSSVGEPDPSTSASARRNTVSGALDSRRGAAESTRNTGRGKNASGAAGTANAASTAMTGTALTGADALQALGAFAGASAGAYPSYAGGGGSYVYYTDPGSTSLASNTSASYKVEHYKQDLEGYYPSSPNESEDHTGTAGGGITVEPKSYAGFSSPEKQTMTLPSSGSATIRFYYERKTYRLTLVEPYHASLTSDVGAGSVLYGEKVTLTCSPEKGYSFGGWNAKGISLKNEDVITFSMPDKDVTAWPSVKDLNGNEVSGISANGAGGAGASEGSSGSGGSTGNGSSGSGNSAGKETYTILFDGNGATSGSMAEMTGVSSDTRVSLPVCLYVRDGFRFAGWNTQAEGGGVSYADEGSIYRPSVPSGGTITLYAQWSPVAYTIHFHANGGSEVTETKELSQGEAYGELPVTHLTGFTMTGWYTARTGGVLVTEETSFLRSYGTTLYAHWRSAALRISYHPNGGVVPGDAFATIPYGEVIGQMPAARRAGYDFLGWYTAKTGGLEMTADTEVTSGGDVTLYARYEAHTDTPYRVEHYKMLADGTYPATPDDTDTGLTGTTDTAVSPAIKTTYGSGYQVPTPQTATIRGDGSLVVRYHYPRTAYTFRIGSAAGVDTTGSTADGSYIWGSTITLKAASAVGYSWTAESAWHSSNTTLQEDIASAEASFIMPQGSIILTPETKVNHYTVHFETMGDTDDPVTLKEVSPGVPKLSDITVAYTDLVSLDQDPATRPHYDFAGYATSDTYTGTPRTWGSVDGWSFSGLTPTDGDTVTLNLRWAGKSVALTEGVFAGKTVTFGLTVGETIGTLPTASLKTGYSFTDWYASDTFAENTRIRQNTIVNATIFDLLEATGELYPLYTPNNYTVTFHLNDTTVSPAGTVTPGAALTKTVTYDSTYGELLSVSRTGYDFAGWYTSADGGTEVSASTLVQITDAQTLYAHWTPKTYAVSFALSDSTQYPADPLSAGEMSKTVTYDAPYDTLPTPTRTGFDFIGWYFLAEGGVEVQSTTIVRITEGATLYAHWQIKSFDVSATGDIHAASITGTGIHEWDSEVTLTATPTPGYHVSAWTDASGGELPAGSTISTDRTSVTFHVPGHNISLSVTTEPNTYTVSYDVNDTDTSPATTEPGVLLTKTVTYDASYGTLLLTQRTGYDFTGWYTSADGGTEVTSSTTVQILGDQTLYAHWTPKTYTVSFNVNGGNALSTEDSSKTVTYDSTYGVLASPTKTGYNFAGWFTETEGGTEITSSTIVRITETQTLYAHWTIKTFSVTAEGDAHVSSITGAGTKEWNSEVSITAAPVSGCHIGTWTDANSSAYTDSLPAGYTLSADKKTLSFAQPEYAVDLSISTLPNTRTIHFHGNGADNAAEMPDQTLTYGVSTILAASTYSKAHYHFLGWGVISGGSDVVYENGADLSGMAEFLANPAGETTLYARWAVNAYAVTASGDSYTSSITGTGTKNWNTSVTLTAAPATGYHVSAWTDANGGSLPTGGTISADKTAITFPMPDNAVSLTVATEPNTYTVTFTTTGADETIQGVTAKTVTYDAAYGTLPTAKKDHYEFLGWFTAAEGGTQRTAVNIVKITADETLYAHWSKNYYTITYNANGGTGAPADSALHDWGTAASISSTEPTRPNYNFKGWALQSNATAGAFAKSGSALDLASTISNASTGVSVSKGGTITLYAVWEAACYQLTLGNTYTFGGYTWIAAEKLADGVYAMQSTGMTGGHWPGYKLTKDYNGTAFTKGSSNYYATDINYRNVANYDGITANWYATYGAAEASGGRNTSNGTYETSNTKNGLYLIPNTKVNQTTHGQQGSGHYWTALKAAATNYSSFGAVSSGSWLGTVNSTDGAWYVVSNSNVSYDSQSYSRVVAPAFNLDTSASKINVNGKQITLTGTGTSSILSIGTTYKMGKYLDASGNICDAEWICAEDLGGGVYAMQSSTGLAKGYWPGRIYNGNSDYSSDYKYTNIAGLSTSRHDPNGNLKAFYNIWASAEASGGRNSSGTYGTSTAKNGLYLIPNTKVNQTTIGQQGSGNYWTALKAAAGNYGSFGAGGGAWLGTVNSTSSAWCVVSGGNVGSDYQSVSYVVAPAFNLDASKVTVSGDTIMLNNPSILSVGTEYTIGTYTDKNGTSQPAKWICAEDLGNGIYVMQSSTGMAAGYWPGRIYNGNSNYSSDYKYTNISGLSTGSYFDQKVNLSSFYSTWLSGATSIEASGGINSSGIYGASTAKNGLYLIPNTKVNQTTSGKQGSGNYWTALKAAAGNYSSFGTSNYGAWLGTVYSTSYSTSYAWCVISDGNVNGGYSQVSSYVVAPAFNLDVSKITLSGTTINK